MTADHKFASKDGLRGRSHVVILSKDDERPLLWRYGCLVKLQINSFVNHDLDCSLLSISPVCENAAMAYTSLTGSLLKE